MKRHLFPCLIFVIALSVTGSAQADPERDSIKRTALNYAEGWYEGNAEKMEGALSPDLAKRIARTNDQGRSSLDQMTAMTLVQSTRTGYGKQTPKDEQIKDVTIMDVIGRAAMVKLEMRDWVDYMHLAKMNGKWVIINVLWEMKPKTTVKKD